jgi:hypothetical protein
MANKKRKIRSAFPGYVLTPEGDHYRAKKIGTSGERIKTAPSYDIVRRNNREFSKIAKFGKVIREALGKHVSFPNATPALVKVLRQVLDTDKESEYGNRSFRKADATALTGFEFNPWLSFHNMVKVDLQIDHLPTKGQLQVTIPAFDPAAAIHDENQLAHFRVVFILLAIDLIDNTCWVQKEGTAMISRKQASTKHQQLKFNQLSDNDMLYLLVGTLESYAPLDGSKLLRYKYCDQPLTVIKTLHLIP